MTLTRKKMVREIGRRTGLTNREVQKAVEALVDVWKEALIEGEKIEMENFFVLEVKEIDRGNNTGKLQGQEKPSRSFKRLVVRASKSLKKSL